VTRPVARNVEVHERDRIWETERAWRCCRIEDSLKLLHGRKPTGRVLLLALLPRAPPPGSSAGPAATGADSGGGVPWPSPLASGILAVNQRLENLADK